MAHFLLYTGPGLLVLTIAAAAVVAFIVWYVVTVVVALGALACWRLSRAVHDPARPPTPYRPGGKA